MIPYLSLLGSKDIIFTHMSHDTGVAHTWNITKLQEWIAAHPPPPDKCKTLAIQTEHVTHVLQKMGIEPHRLARITPQDLIDYPIIAVDWPDGTTSIIDGNHRFARAGLEGLTGIRAYVFAVADLEPFEIDFPQELQQIAVQNTNSGIG